MRHRPASLTALALLALVLLAGCTDDTDGGTSGRDGDPSVSGPRAVGHLDDGTRGEDGSFTGPHHALAGNGDVAMTMPELAAWTTALFTGHLLGPTGTEAVLGAVTFDHGEGRSETPGWIARPGWAVDLSRRT